MTDMIKFAYASHIGKIRINNEDNLWCDGFCLPAENTGTGGVRSGDIALSDFPVFAVMDGMGGESCGEQASYLSASEFGRFFREEEALKKEYPQALSELCRRMNQQVVHYAVENHVRTMGSTTVFLVFAGNRAYAGNLGDSRLYHLSEDDFRQISTDHVYSREIGGKGPLLQYLGMMEPDEDLDPSLVTLTPRSLDTFLLCSDGVTDMVSDEELLDILLSCPEPEEAVEKILDSALTAGGRDNITAIVCRYPQKSLFSRLRFWR